MGKQFIIIKSKGLFLVMDVIYILNIMEFKKNIYLQMNQAQIVVIIITGIRMLYQKMENKGGFMH